MTKGSGFSLGKAENNFDFSSGEGGIRTHEAG